MTKKERLDTVLFVIVHGPNWHDIMNSFSGAHLGDAYPVSFAIRSGGNKVWTVTGKVVGIRNKNTEPTNMCGVLVQLGHRLSEYNPVRPDLVDLSIEFYRTIERTGQGRMTLAVYRELYSSNI